MATSSEILVSFTRPCSINLRRRRLSALGLAAAGLLMLSFNSSAQEVLTPSGAQRAVPAAWLVASVDDALPDAPLPVLAGERRAQGGYSSSRSAGMMARAGDTIKGNKTAGPYTKYIEPGEPVPHLTARDKVILGVKDAVSPFSMVAWVASAGYEQALDNSPNYGSNGKAFAQRLGASALRDFTEGTFGDSVLAPLLHEDPRYYRIGKGHSFFKRALYAGSRGLITRTDGGRSTPNLANIGGNLGGALLTDVYYPDHNTSLSETMETFGTSVGGSALGFAVSEFLPDIFHAFHLPAPGY